MLMGKSGVESDSYDMSEKGTKVCPRMIGSAEEGS